MKSTWLYALVLSGMVTVSVQPLRAQARYEFSELHMGVAVRIVLYAPSEHEARTAARTAFDRVASLEQKMSDYRPKSEVRLLERRAGRWVVVSQDLFTVVARAIEVAAASDGAFDPTVGPLVALWREARRERRLPSARELRVAGALVGWRRIGLDSARRRVRLPVSGIRVDLGGIAKGYAVEQAVLALRGRGVTSALVEAGGDIAVGSAPPGQPGWRVDAPTGDFTVRGKASALTNAVISTSGPDVQFVEIGGTRYSHVIDPRTGIGLTSGARATVIAADGATADALSTALTVLDEPGATRLLARFPGVIVSVQR